MILTLTGNLLAERTHQLAPWAVGGTHRAQAETFQVGGKGINVARMLHRLGEPVTALAFAGGAPGAECAAWLRDQGWSNQLFATAQATRVGLVVRAHGQPETTFLGPDAAPDPAACAAAAAWLQDQPDGRWLALCGSFPGWTSQAVAPLRAALARWAARGHLVADTYGPPLRDCLRLPLRLIKINRQEFTALLATESAEALAAPTGYCQFSALPQLVSQQPVSSALSALLDAFPVAAWVVTDGPEAVYWAARGSAPDACTATLNAAAPHACAAAPGAPDHVFEPSLAPAPTPAPAPASTAAPVPARALQQGSLRPPVVTEVSATGSGDVFLACLLHALTTRQLPLAAAIRFALPYAAANTAHPGIADFPLDSLPALPDSQIV